MSTQQYDKDLRLFQDKLTELSFNKVGPQSNGEQTIAIIDILQDLVKSKRIANTSYLMLLTTTVEALALDLLRSVRAASRARSASAPNN